jgi:hypothetical protein
MRSSRRIGWSGALVPVVIAVLLATAAPAQAATVVAVWNMDGSGSTMTDSSGRGHNGKLHNVVPRGSFYEFRGKPSYVTVPSHADFAPGTGNFKISLSVRFSAAPSAAVVDYDLLRKGLSGTAGGHYKVEILQSGRAFCQFRGSAGMVTISNGPNLANNAWHKITCTRTGNTAVLTVDGASWSKTGAIGSISNSSAVLLGAKNTTGGDQYTGLMDSVTVTKG